MSIISYSKCQKCNVILLESELKQNDEGIGLVCIDTMVCKKRVYKNNENKKDTTSHWRKMLHLSGSSISQLKR